MKINDSLCHAWADWTYNFPVPDPESLGVVEQLTQRLKSYGIEVWLDRNNFHPGQRWKSAIREAMMDGDCFLS